MLLQIAKRNKGFDIEILSNDDEKGNERYCFSTLQELTTELPIIINEYFKKQI